MTQTAALRITFVGLAIAMTAYSFEGETFHPLPGLDEGYLTAGGLLLALFGIYKIGEEPTWLEEAVSGLVL